MHKQNLKPKGINIHDWKQDLDTSGPLEVAIMNNSKYINLHTETLWYKSLNLGPTRTKFLDT